MTTVDLKVCVLHLKSAQSRKSQENTEVSDRFLCRYVDRDTPIQNIGTIKGISLEPVNQRSTGTNQCLFTWMFMSTFINALTAVANGQKLNSKNTFDGIH